MPRETNMAVGDADTEVGAHLSRGISMVVELNECAAVRPAAKVEAVTIQAITSYGLYGLYSRRAACRIGLAQL